MGRPRTPRIHGRSRRVKAIAASAKEPMPVRHLLPRKTRSARERRGLLVSVHRAVATGEISGALAQAIKRWSQVWGTLDLRRTVSVRENRRLRTSIARWVIAEHRLEVSPRFFALDLEHEAILCHELAHAAVIAKYGRRIRPHGPEWRSLVRAVGFDPRPLEVARQPDARARPRSRNPRTIFVHRCPVCQAVRYARRPMRMWRCAACVELGLAGALEMTVTGPAGVPR